LLLFGAFVSLTIGSVSALYIAPVAHAAVDPACKSALLGLPQWFEYLDVGQKIGSDGTVVDDCAVIGPPTADGSLDWEKAAPRVALAIIQILLRIAGIVALVFTIYGGFRYILSQGEPDATKKAKGTIVGAAVGLVIAMFAATIVGFVGNILWK
ncbi:hypothetical protein KC957_03890, partial [Candidatus Saccharibacteria bacterium]|nr:hypothetical protein [Candidatus Saccharibacteria bacterium]